MFRSIGPLALVTVLVGIVLFAGLAPPAPSRATSANVVPELSRGRVTTRTWSPPVRPTRIERRFDPPAARWGRGHRGIDMLSRPGQTVRAVGAGVVRFAGGLAGRGVVVVEHGPLRSTYEPVVATVRLGQWVTAGQRLGHVAGGAGHCGTGRCLHLGIRRDADYLDPLLLLGRRRVVLVPW